MGSCVGNVIPNPTRPLYCDLDPKVFPKTKRRQKRNLEQKNSGISKSCKGSPDQFGQASASEAAARRWYVHACALVVKQPASMGKS